MPTRPRLARYRIKPLRLFALSAGAGLAILFGGYTALAIMLADPVEVRLGPLNEAMLTA